MGQARCLRIVKMQSTYPVRPYTSVSATFASRCKFVAILQAFLVYKDPELLIHYQYTTPSLNRIERYKSSTAGSKERGMLKLKVACAKSLHKAAWKMRVRSRRVYIQPTQPPGILRYYISYGALHSCTIPRSLARQSSIDCICLQCFFYFPPPST